MALRCRASPYDDPETHAQRRPGGSRPRLIVPAPPRTIRSALPWPPLSRLPEQLHQLLVRVVDPVFRPIGEVHVPRAGREPQYWRRRTRVLHHARDPDPAARIAEGAPHVEIRDVGRVGLRQLPRLLRFVNRRLAELRRALHLVRRLLTVRVLLRPQLPLRDDFRFLQKHRKLAFRQLAPAFRNRIETPLVVATLRLEDDPPGVVQLREVVLVLRARTQIVRRHVPGSPFAPRAIGKLANCHLSLSRTSALATAPPNEPMQISSHGE